MKAKVRKNLKQKLSVILVIALAAICFADARPAMAGEYEAHEVLPYTAKNPNNMLGVAADFGLFIEHVCNMTAHSDTNVACGDLKLTNSNITHTTTGTISYARDVSVGNRDIAVKGGENYLYVGSNHWVHKNDRVWYVDWQHVGEHLTAVYNESAYAPFIDLAAEFNRLRGLAANLSAISSQGTSYYRGDSAGNGIRLDCYSDYNVINLSAYDLSVYGERDLNITGLRGKKLLIVNVDMSNVGSQFDFNRKINFDGRDVADFDQDACNVIWNFGSYNGTINTRRRSAGVILAPDANVFLAAGNHMGIIIAQNFSNTCEAHFVPFNYEIPSVKVYIDSVDGTCCPSTPLGSAKVALYKEDGTMVGNEIEVSLDFDGRYRAAFEVKEAGSYYIKETYAPFGYIQTPILCKFDVVFANGSLTAIGIIGNQNEGVSNTWNAETNTFKLRHYRNEVYMIAFSAKNYAVLENAEFQLYECTSDGVMGNPVSTFYYNNEGLITANVPSSGYYCVVQTKTNEGYIVSDEIMVFAIYITPTGRKIMVEMDKGSLSTSMINILGPSMNIDNLSSNTQEAIKQLAQNFGIAYEEMTDECLMFFNDLIRQRNMTLLMEGEQEEAAAEEEIGQAEEEKPADIAEPSEEENTAEAAESSEEEKSTEAAEPSEDEKSAEAAEPSEEENTAEAVDQSDEEKPAEAAESSEEEKPAEAGESGEQAETLENEENADDTTANEDCITETSQETAAVFEGAADYIAIP